jgi:serine O-acetyltransferase
VSAISSTQLWDLLQQQARELAESTPFLRDCLRAVVLDHGSFAEGLAHLLVQALQDVVPAGIDLASVFGQALCSHPQIVQAAQADLEKEKLAATNPACPDALSWFMSFRGFQALQLYRINHALWTDGQRHFAVLLQNWGALRYSIDIHPQARIGSSVFLDHGIGVVIGSTAVVEDEANIWHGVTLGSTLTQAGDRHPKVRRGVTIGTGATILGNIEVGEGAIVAAGSVVLRPVDPFTVVAGVPAKVVGSAKPQLDAIAHKVR